MDFGFFTDPDRTRYCYLRLRRLKEAIKNPRALDAVLEELEVADDGARSSSPRSKLTAIERQIDALRADETSIWHGVSAPEVLAAALFGARRFSGGAADNLFNEVARKEDLAAPIARWLTVAGFAPYAGLPPGATRVDVVAYQVGQFLTKPRIIGIELVNEPGQLPAAVARLSACASTTNATYLACTPAAAADILLTHATAPGVSRWDPAVLQNQLVAVGSGLLIIEGEAVSEPLAPKVRKLDAQGLAKPSLRPR